MFVADSDSDTESTDQTDRAESVGRYRGTLIHACYCPS